MKFIDELLALLHQVASNQVVQNLATIGAAAIGLVVLVGIAIVALIIGLMLLSALSSLSGTSDPGETTGARVGLGKATGSAGNPQESAGAPQAVAQTRQRKRAQRTRLLVLVLGIPTCLLLLIAVLAPTNERASDESRATSSHVAQSTGEGNLVSRNQGGMPTFDMRSAQPVVDVPPAPSVAPNPATAISARESCEPIRSSLKRMQTATMTRAVDGLQVDAEIEIAYEAGRTGRCIPLVLVRRLPPFPPDFDSTISFTPPEVFCTLWRAAGEAGVYAYGKSMQNGGKIHACDDPIVLDPRLF